MNAVTKQSKLGRWWIGPMDKKYSLYRWIGPYDRRKDAESDRIGIAKFIKQEIDK